MRRILARPDRQPVWSEEDQAWVGPVPKSADEVPRFSTAVRKDVQIRNYERAADHAHEATRTSIIYTPAGQLHGNFMAASYGRILANPDWAARLTKVHTARKQARPTGAQEETRVWRELDAASSSDALLMNIFCYPGVTSRKALLHLLGVDHAYQPSFGVRAAVNLKRKLKDRTEVDMRLGSLLVEAKLTEADFQYAPMRLLERYQAFDEIFDRGLLQVTPRGTRSYQLIRGVLAAAELQCSFAVMADARRPDLREDWLAVLQAVRGCELRTRLRFHTWQEVAATLPPKLQGFLAVKYGIVSCGKGLQEGARSTRP